VANGRVLGERQRLSLCSRPIGAGNNEENDAGHCQDWHRKVRGGGGRSKNENKRSYHERKRNVLRGWRAEGEVREFESQRGMSSYF
jgi:hypothetical protein